MESSPITLPEPESCFISMSKSGKLQKLLESLKQEYTEQNPLSQRAFEKAQEYLPGGNTRSVLQSDPFPLMVKSARGPYITSLDGREYLDYLSDYSAAFLGHSSEAVQHALSKAIQNGFGFGAITTMESELASRINKRFPSMEKMRFANSGTEANTYALAAALAFTGKKKVK
jgi:glutamate-1-semialdehyde 2,1-aminomutase